MNAEVFLDTNVLVYAFATEDRARHGRSLELLATGNWCVSWQVIQEFSNVALHKFATPMRNEDLEEFLSQVLWPRCTVSPSLAVWQSAYRIQRSTNYRFFDSLIVAGALASGARTLLTEDLQHNRRIGDLHIINPYL
jgi:predicted nucleic acid-binding protein